MHELSIANYLVTLVEQQLAESQPRSALTAGCDEAQSATPLAKIRVQALYLKIGALSCVHRDALQFSFELAAQGTRLEGASLHIETVPVMVYCTHCCEVIELPSIQSFRCPTCQTPSADIRAGRELDLVAIELE